jgi:hypothetical protein
MLFFLLICGQNLNLKKGYKVETLNELLQHSYSLSSLRDFKKNLEVLYDDVTKAFEIVQMNLSTF